MKRRFEILGYTNMELEFTLSQEQEKEGIMRQFQEEVRRFAALEITDKEMFRDVFHQLIKRVEIAEDGSIVIHDNFRKLLRMGT